MMTIHTIVQVLLVILVLIVGAVVLAASTTLEEKVSFYFSIHAVMSC